MTDFAAVKKSLLQKAKELLAEEASALASAREETLKERVKPLPEYTSMDEEQLKQLCRELHAAIDKADEQRYDAEYKIEKNNKETEELKRKHAELKAKMKKPALKRIRMTPEEMMSTLLAAK
ncbi:Oidioi.mRNA.OKI2018_I69.chr1.g1490.t1.cds [Oikopleura dioica]|uniref:Oidioi.mRNA.OKI2018_I69.chr1.g1490.t1.cds n=1 Tax=Oikopleura dioica TaxID=34765 RepID=A0ABN7SSB9_OIKDI|nr:Oidioi.mRNA.OKI2018_I69.chr1.g1490.t1.cds [Oikopleura dioica]